MKWFILAAALTLAGCDDGGATQTALQLTPSNNIANAEPVPTAYIAGPSISDNGRFNVTLGSGKTLSGTYAITPDTNQGFGLGGPAISNNTLATGAITMRAANGSDTMQCTGNRSAAGLDVVCNGSDGSVYQAGP